MSEITIGTCSLCGGRVSIPAAWMATIPPTPTCQSCGAIGASHGPIVPMRPAPRFDSTATWGGDTKPPKVSR